MARCLAKRGSPTFRALSSVVGAECNYKDLPPGLINKFKRLILGIYSNGLALKRWQ